MPFSTWLVVLACTMSVIYQNCQNQLTFLTIAKTPTNKRKPPDHLNTINTDGASYFMLQLPHFGNESGKCN